MQISNSSVLITGGASGIGKIMGRIALEKGAANLIIWDINKANIELTVKELSVLGNVKGYSVDVSDAAAVESAYCQVVKDC
ncbi:MAG: SDR family NAD(P)-dependent oxidoreductase, partial [Candidatus Cryptobacteroides sp.]